MAYAAVTSLMTTLGLFLMQTNSTRNRLHKKAEALDPQIQSLCEKVRSLQTLLEVLDNMNDVDQSLKHCETKINVAAHDAEDRIESIVGEIYSKKEKSNDRAFKCLFDRLLQASESMDSGIKELERCIMNKGTDHNKISLESLPQALSSKFMKKSAYGRLLESLRQAFKSIGSKRKESMRRMKKDVQATSSFTRSFNLPEHCPPQFDNNVVGREIELDDMMSQLMRTSSKETEVVAIVGMGGIGKTTFARRVYNDPIIEAHFVIRAWVTMSREYCIRKMLLELFHCIDESLAAEFEKDCEMSDGDLAAEFKKKLQRGRYFLVIDDIWSTNAWDDISQWFPDYKGSQILLTTRCGNVASYAAQGNSPNQMSPLSPTESWELFQDRILVKEQLPPEFVEIGKNIAYNCQGLPLTIVVVAGILSKCNNALDRWNQVEQNVKSAMFEDSQQQCEKVLSSSYHYLPRHLKACFLYFGVFPEDTEVHVKRLIELWVAEGFLKEAADTSLESIAEGCIHELIDRNLVFISRYNFCGEVKTCKIHDLLHELCLREAQSENFLFVFPRSIHVCPKECHRMIVKSNCDFDEESSYPFDPKKIRTFIYSGESFVQDLNIDKLFVSGILGMIRVMSLGNLTIGDLSYRHSTYPTRPSNFVHLRYLSVAIRNSSAFLLIPKLHNLQSLFVHIGFFHRSNLPIYLDIWTLPQLRSLHFVKIKRGPPFPLIMPAIQMEGAVLEHLHTITGVAPEWCTNEIFASMPNLKKLGIRFDELHEIRSPSFDLSCLLVVEGLEAVKIEFDVAYELCSVRLLRPSTPRRFLRKNIFPITLKKLTLVKSHFSWKDMDIVGTLPYLEALKLKNHACAGDEWKPAAGGFPLLKFLSLDCIRFTKWEATDENFPVLERLRISQCWELRKIPEEFAYISTLEVIELDECSLHLAESAQQIPQEQEECLGSKGTKVCVSRIRTMDDSDEELNEDQASKLVELGYFTFKTNLKG